MKRALYATVKPAVLNEEEFRTAVSKISWMLNQRPIQKVRDNLEIETMTPGHFLGGCPEVWKDSTPMVRPFGPSKFLPTRPETCS